MDNKSNTVDLRDLKLLLEELNDILCDFSTYGYLENDKYYRVYNLLKYDIFTYIHIWYHICNSYYKIK